jgi:hypothetical protein
MIGSREILERRLLAALGQAARVEMPVPWRTLRPREAEALRPAAAVLLRVAQRRSRKEMVQDLRDTAERVKASREGRAGGEQELWLEVAMAIERLGELSPDRTGLLGLALWGRGVPLIELSRAFRDLRPEELTTGEPFLGAAARTLLQTLARSWTDAAREKEKS